jgi:hypothetical protein
MALRAVRSCVALAEAAMGAEVPPRVRRKEPVAGRNEERREATQFDADVERGVKPL